jgi:hypothetical protein
MLEYLCLEGLKLPHGLVLAGVFSKMKDSWPQGQHVPRNLHFKASSTFFPLTPTLLTAIDSLLAHSEKDWTKEM